MREREREEEWKEKEREREREEGYKEEILYLQTSHDDKVYSIPLLNSLYY